MITRALNRFNNDDRALENKKKKNNRDIPRNTIEQTKKRSLLLQRGSQHQIYEYRHDVDDHKSTESFGQR
jgi:hypothetical protein